MGEAAMTEITLKEIPVQILRLNEGDILVLRVPPEWFKEQRYYLQQAVTGPLFDSDKGNQVLLVNNNIDLAIVTK